MIRSREELTAIRRSVERVGRLSDGLLRLGPLKLGAEAALSWIPGVGEIYGAAAAAFLIGQGLRAGAPLRVLVAAGLLMGGRTLISAVPVAGPLTADVLALHGVSARMIARAIDRKLGEAESAAPDGRAWRWGRGHAAA